MSPTTTDMPFGDLNALLGMYYPFFQIIHPKSDSQRKSLLEGVKQILLFRSLEPEQLTEVLDAMFERKVTPNEYIIRQGDDGDNFYVVERFVPDNKQTTNKHTHVVLYYLQKYIYLCYCLTPAFFLQWYIQHIHKTRK